MVCALNAITSFYTLYIDMLILVLYVVARLGVRAAHDGTISAWRREFVAGVHIALFCLAGILLSAIVLLPILYGYSINSRVMSASGYTASLWHYGWNFYPSLLENLFSATGAKYWTTIGMNAFAIVPLAILFTNKGNATTKICIVAILIMLCIPVAGRIMNGFGYAINRFAFALPLFASVAFVEVYPQLIAPSRRDRVIALSVGLLFAAVCVCLTPSDKQLIFYSMAACIAAVCIIWAVTAKFGVRKMALVILALVLLSSFYQIGFRYSPAAKGAIGNHITLDAANAKVYGLSSIAAPMERDGFQRIATEERVVNLDGFNNVYGTGMWWSVIPEYVSRYYLDTQLDTAIQNCNFQGIDARPGLLGMASVRYYTTPGGSKATAPLGFEEIGSHEGGYRVYENQHALPLGYAYRRAFAESDVKDLNGVELELAMLNGAVVEDSIAETIREFPETHVEEIAYTTSSSAGVKLADTGISWKGKGSTLTLEAEIPEGSVAFLFMEDPKLRKASSSGIRIIVNRDDFQTSTSGMLTGKKNKWPVIRDGIVFYLGEGGKGKTSIELTFTRRGKISFKGMHILTVDLSAYLDALDELGEEALRDVTYQPNSINGRIEVDEQRILQLSIPYSKGWRAYVDGQEADIFISGIMYTGIELDAGRHEIELFYETPYLREGLLVSLLVLVALLVTGAVRGRSRRARSGAT